ncbi:MAG TPA: hypothetical protein VIF09_08690 [Polyangiaceae bacterium]|jgi:hypothetical protein
MAAMKVAWPQVVTALRAIEAKRRTTGRIDEEDASRLVDLLLEFQKQVVARTLSGEMEAVEAPDSKH